MLSLQTVRVHHHRYVTIVDMPPWKQRTQLTWAMHLNISPILRVHLLFYVDFLQTFLFLQILLRTYLFKNFFFVYLAQKLSIFHLLVLKLMVFQNALLVRHILPNILVFLSPDLRKQNPLSIVLNMMVRPQLRIPQPIQIPLLLKGKRIRLHKKFFLFIN